jgi:Putative auto-transporter adhesin, head GIN domain
MTRIVPALLALLAAAAPAAAVERRYPVTDFDRIQVEGPYKVSLRTGLSSGATATGSALALDRVTIEVQGRTLRIRANRSAWGGYPGDAAGPVTIEATTRALTHVSVGGSGSLDVDRAEGLRLDLSVVGSSRLAVAAVEADNLLVGLVGSGRMILAGKAKQLRATVQGSGDLDGRGLSADDLQLNADTAGTVAVRAVRTAKVNARGLGDVEILGTPACTVEALGAGNVTCGR